MDRIVEYQFSNDELVILNWIEYLITKNEGVQKGKAFLTRNTTECSGLNKDMGNGIYYWSDVSCGINETFRYYMLNFDKLMGDLRNISNSQKTYSRYIDHLCGIGPKCDKSKIYPLSKIIRYCEFGKKTFFCLNPAVILYLKGEIDNMDDLFDDRVQPVENLPKKELPPLNDRFLSFYDKACKIYPFKHKLPKDGESSSALLATCQQYYDSILANTFKDKIKLKKPTDTDLSDASEKGILMALIRWTEYMEANRPKEKLSLDTFFYNPRQMMSYFLVNYSIESSVRKEKNEREDNREFMDTTNTGFDELWIDLCKRSEYASIDGDKVVHNAFFRMYKEIEKDSDKFDKANLANMFLKRTFWLVFLDCLVWKSPLVKDDFNLQSKRCGVFIAKMYRYGYKIFMDRENHEDNQRLWNKASKRVKIQEEEKKKNRNLNKSIDDLDAIIVPLTEDETEQAKESLRLLMLQEIGDDLGDYLWADKNKNMSFDEVKRIHDASAL
jgi:hypothetical protein